MKTFGSLRRFYVTTALILISTLLTGCDSTPQNFKPFEEFKTSAETLRDGSNTAIDLIIPQTTKRYEDYTDISPDSFKNLHSLTISSDDAKGPFVVEKVPIYLVYERFKS